MKKYKYSCVSRLFDTVRCNFVRLNKIFPFCPTCPNHSMKTKNFFKNCPTIFPLRQKWQKPSQLSQVSQVSQVIPPIPINSPSKIDLDGAIISTPSKIEGVPQRGGGV